MKVILLFAFLYSSYASAAKNENWQGTYFPNGCLECESEYIYSPIFKSFSECKKWATKKMKSEIDKASCGRGCVYQGKMDVSKCNLVVRSWTISLLPDSPTFINYKDR